MFNFINVWFKIKKLIRIAKGNIFLQETRINGR